MRQTEVVTLVLKELQRSETVHPYWPRDMIHAAAILAEEAGETIQAAINYENGLQTKVELNLIRTEAIQTAAMALRLLKEIDSETRN